MKKKHKVQRKAGSSDVTKNNAEKKPEITTLYQLAASRVGGAVNFRGIGFQLLYSLFQILEKLKIGEINTIRLEGLEDIDLHLFPHSEFIQVKTSVDTLDANRIWTMKVLQNFYDVYRINSNVTFRLVHNTSIAGGMLDVLTKNDRSANKMEFWQAKFKEDGISLTQDQLRDFINRVSIEHRSENVLLDEINQRLFKDHDISIGTEMLYLKALFYNLFDWARARQTVSFEDLAAIIQNTRDAFARFPSNEAIRNSWVMPLSYDVQNWDLLDYSGYYDGNAARPIDIALGLNVKRPKWEKAIDESVKNNGVTLIKSSSGQGKSTLAYQIGYNYKSAGNNVYRIEYCPTYNEARQISDFFETRFRIGETPLIIIDGLNNSVAGWTEVAKQLVSKPCGLIVTSREEDWKRFGVDLTIVPVNEVNIFLAESEANEIYQLLKNAGKVSTSIITWQPAWEKVKERGLLIEFVFLLTQGQMISERLNVQISQINRSDDAAAKLELLRLISLADVLNIKLSTQLVSEYIKSNFRLTTDLNELFRHLEKEYYVKFQRQHIQGLHPVRSTHLLNLLNSEVGLEPALENVLNVAEEEYVYDYFMNVLLQFKSIDMDRFIQSTARIVSRKPLTSIVYAIDGIMHGEPYRFWEDNKEVIDAAFHRGGFILFLHELLPFREVSIFDGLAESLSGEMRENILSLKVLTDQLTKFDIQKSKVVKFTKHLSEELTNIGKVANYEGVAFLYKWFRWLKVSFPDIVDISEDKLLKALVEKEVSESSELFHFYHLTAPARYKLFVEDNYNFIVGWIKRKTNTLTITKGTNEVHINYLLTDVVDSANEQSVYRINIVHAFLPGFERYCTEGIILPVPNEAVTKVAVMNSTKHMPPENLGDDFNVHVNQIWLKTISNQYCAASFYEWQEQYYNLRNQFVETVRLTIKLLEAHLEKDNKRIISLSNKVAEAGTLLLEQERQLKKLPPRSGKYFEKEPFHEEEANILKCLSPFRNFLNQLRDLFVGDFRLPIYNLKDCILNLNIYQDSLNSIAASTVSYFDMKNLDDLEFSNLTKLLKTTERYKHYVENPGQQKIIVARNEVEVWWQERQNLELAELQSILDKIEDETGLKLIRPKFISEDGSLKSVVIGVEGIIDFDDDIWNLLQSATFLTQLDIHAFTFLLVSEGKTSAGIRVTQEFFEKLIDAFNGEEVEESITGNPLPVTPDAKMVEGLGIMLNTVKQVKSDESFYRAMINAWTLHEYRSRLVPENAVELEWLNEISQKLMPQIQIDLDNFEMSDALNQEGRKAIERFLGGEDQLTKDITAEWIVKRATKTNTVS